MKLLPLLLALLLLNNPLSAQIRPGGPVGQNPDRMEALRIAFFTEALSLTPEEAEVFWPVMHEEREKMEAHRAQMDSLQTALDAADEMSDEEAFAHLEALADLRLEDIALKNQMLLTIANTLGPQRALEIPKLEERFRRRIIEEVQQRRNAGGIRPRPR